LQCPYCRASLRGYLAEHREGGHLLDNIKYCPRDDRLSALITAVSPSVAQQRRSQIAESEAAASANNSMEGEVGDDDCQTVVCVRVCACVRACVRLVLTTIVAMRLVLFLVDSI
jgi:hypothetical protein